MSDKETLFSAKNRELLLGPLSKNNPVLVQILGICSALAVTAKMEPAIVMALSVTAVTAFSNVILSLLRNTIPTRIRIIVQLVVVAALVIIVDQVLTQLFPGKDIHTHGSLVGLGFGRGSPQGC